MVYSDRQAAKDDLRWLVQRCSISSVSLHLNDYETDTFINNLHDHTDKFIFSFYQDILDLLGFESHTVVSHIDENALPMLAFIPKKGICVVFAKEPTGEWKCESKDGVMRWQHFPKGTRFLMLKRARSIREKLSANELFKRIALQEKRLLIYIAIATISINTCALGVSFFSMQVYDRVIPTQGIYTLIALGVGVFIAIILDFLLKLARSYLIDSASIRIDTKSAHELFRRFLSVRADAVPRSVGTLSAKLQNYVTIRTFITTATVYFLIDLPFLMIFFSVIVMLSGWLVGAVVLVFLGLAIISGFVFQKKIMMLSKTQSLASHKRMGLLVENIDNLEYVKATGAHWDQLNRWNALSKDAIRDELEMKRYNDLSTYMIGFLQQSSYVSVVIAGAYLVTTTDQLTMGGLIATTILSGRVLSPIVQLANLLVHWGRAKVAAEDLDGILLLEEDNEGIDRPIRPTVMRPSIQCKDIRFAYDRQSGVQTIQIKNLEIKSGESVAIIGSVGSGKSTLLKVLAGLYKPYEGQVMFDHLDMQHIARSALTESIGYLPQHVKLISGTLRDNIMMGLSGVTDEMILDAAEKTGLIALIKALPQGLDTPVPEGGESVSGGQKQLIALTRLFVMKPKLLLLDEPTANMDDGTERRILHALSEMKQEGVTLVIVTHKMALLQIVDRLVVLTSAGIAMDGPKEGVLKQLQSPNTTKKKG